MVTIYPGDPPHRYNFTNQFVTFGDQAFIWYNDGSGNLTVCLSNDPNLAGKCFNGTSSDFTILQEGVDQLIALNQNKTIYLYVINSYPTPITYTVTFKDALRGMFCINLVVLLALMFLL